MDITGYHGTSRKSAEDILATSHFFSSREDDEWAGHGIYFFIDGYTMSSAKQNASKYAICVKHFSNIVVLQAIIRTEGLRILDLTNREDQNKFIACFEFLCSESIKRFGDLGTRTIRDYRPHVIECRAINSLCFKLKYEAVIKSEYINFYQTPNHSHPYSSVPNCTMFCLRNEKYIDKLQVLEN